MIGSSIYAEAVGQAWRSGDANAAAPDSCIDRNGASPGALPYFSGAVSGLLSGRPLERDMARLGRDARQPAADARIFGQVIAALVSDMRIGVERDVGHRVAAADQPLVTGQPPFHDAKGVAALLKPVGDELGRYLRLAVRIDVQVRARHGDGRLVLVLFEE